MGASLMLVRRTRLAAAEARIEALETENRGYTDIVTNALLDAATDAISEGYVAAMEIAAGQLSRAMSSASVSGAGADAFTRDFLAQAGRSLVEAGEAVWYVVGRRLVRADNYGLDPDGTYIISLPDNGQVRAPANRVFHARWAVDLASGRGTGPLARARTLRSLMQRLEASLATESNAAIGYLLPIPQDGAARSAEQLRKDLADLKGRIAVIETTRGGWGEGPTGSPRQDYQLARMGPNYPASSIQLFKDARDTVLAACGYPVQLVMGSDGTGQREAWRRYLHGTVSPLGGIIEDAAMRCGLPVTLGFEGLFASDVQGRARAFQSLVNGGMSLEAAAAASGILTPSEE